MKTIKLNDIKKISELGIDFSNQTIQFIPSKLYNNIIKNNDIKNKDIFIQNCINFLNDLDYLISNNEQTNFPIIREYFKSNFGKLYNTNTKLIKNILSESNIITTVTNNANIWYDYTIGIAKTYRVHNDYFTNQDYIIITKNIIKEINIDIDIDNRFVKTICEEELDYNLVIQKELEYYKTYFKSKKANNKLKTRLNLAFSINSKRFIKKGNKVNRIYHSFSNLSRITRKCFKTKYYNIDIKNSQPIFLILYLKQNNIKFEKEYKKIVEEGKFYELFYNLTDRNNYNNDNDHRSAVKQNVYKSFFFDFKENNKYTLRLKELFPKVYNVLRDLNDRNIKLAGILQNLEAELFNNLKVKYSNKFFTLFDAMYFNNKKDISIIKKQIKQYGYNYNIKFSLDIDMNESIDTNTNTNINESIDFKDSTDLFNNVIINNNNIKEYTIQQLFEHFKTIFPLIDITDIKIYINKDIKINHLEDILKDINIYRLKQKESILKSIKTKDNTDIKIDIKTNINIIDIDIF